MSANAYMEALRKYIDTHPFDGGDSGCETVLDQFYQIYQESHESDPPDIREGFRELDKLLGDLSLEDNNAVFNLCCRICSGYERKGFIDGVRYGAYLTNELNIP